MSSESDVSKPYFAYGTLLGLSHMRERYPSAEPIGHAVYAGHELGFWRYADGVEGGGCTIVESPGRDLIGVLYRLNADDTARLLQVDGLRDQYEVRHILVVGRDGETIPAYTLRVDPDNGSWPPPDDYAGLVTSGATEAGLPATYRARLEDIIRAARQSA